MGYLFRKAEEQDVKEVIALYQEATANMIRNNILQWDELYPNEEILLGDINQGEMYLLCEDEKIVGCVVINEEQDELYLPAPWKYTEGKIMVIHRLCIHPNVQGSGNGKRMMQLTEEHIKNQGYHAIRLDTFSQNHFARSLYEKLGYTYVGEIHFRKGLFYLMEKLVTKI